jgi:O-antigen/teichoic acid export membrane protein
MRKKLVINSLSGGAQLLFSTLLVIITIPIFISKIGMEYYGIFSLVLVVSNFSFFFGLGINLGLIKFLSEQGKSRESSIDILTAYLFLILALLPFTILGLLFNNFIVGYILNVPAEYITEDTLGFFNFLIIANFFQFIIQIPISILDSLQKIYLTNLFQSLHQIMYWSLMLVSIFIFGSLQMVGLAVLISVIIWMLILLRASKLHWGKVWINELKLKELTASLRKQISYTYKIYFGNIINFFYEPLTKILIASFIGISEVGYFDIILRFRTQVWTLINKLLYPLFPFISQLKDKLSIRKIIHDVEQKLSYFIFFLIACVIYVTPDFMNIWLKQDASIITIGMILILTSNLIGIIVVPLYQFLVLKGFPGKTIVLQSLNVIVNLIIFFVFYKSLGFMAVIIGNMTAILSSFTLCLFYQKKYLNSLIFDNVFNFIKAMVLLVLILITGYFIDALITDPVLEIIILPAVLAVATILFIRLLKLISPEDIVNYSGENKRVRNILTKIFTPHIGRAV